MKMERVRWFVEGLSSCACFEHTGLSCIFLSLMTHEPSLLILYLYHLAESVLAISTVPPHFIHFPPSRFSRYDSDSD